MYKIITLMFSLLSANMYAGSSAIFIAYGTGDVPVNSHIDIDAEYVAMSVSLSSDAKYPSKRAELISQLQSSIKASASKNLNIDFQQGVVSLSPREKSSFSISKSYRANSGSSFYLLSKLDSKNDVYTATQLIYRFINKIQKPKDTNLSLGNTSLAINSPNNYRKQLLQLVKEEISSAKEILGSSYNVSISGLENPVLVRQKDDQQVTLFLDYRIKLSE